MFLEFKGLKINTERVIGRLLSGHYTNIRLKHTPNLHVKKAYFPVLEFQTEGQP